MKIAALQMTSGSVVSANLEQAEKLIAQACEAGADLVLLPENFSFFAKNDRDYMTVAEAFSVGEVQQFLQAQALKHNCFIVGPMALKDDDCSKVKSALLVYNRQGEVVARYDKIHLFDVTVPQSDEMYQESDIFAAGDKVVVVETELGRLGLCVCYDVRFPELFRLMLKQDVDIILVPSAFTKLTGQAHWETLLKARAIENLSFVVAANQNGFHVNGRETYGHSLIVDPWGNVLERLENGPGVVISEINQEQQKTLREQFPVLEHRKISFK